MPCATLTLTTDPYLDIERHGDARPLFDTARWDFGMRYLERDLPPVIYRRFCELMFVQDLKDLETKLETSGGWGAALLKELGPSA